jgi:hypothetical protein
MISYHSPSGSFFEARDYLDHFFVLQKLWAEQVGFMDYDDYISNVFGGINGNLLGFNDFSLLQILLKIFDPFIGLVISDITHRVLGFIGTICLLSLHPNINKTNKSVTYLFACLFALFPTIPSYTPTFQSFPILTFIGIKILKNPTNLANILIFFLLSQNISFIYGGFAFFSTLSVILIVFLYLNKIRFVYFITLQLFLFFTIMFTNIRILQDLFLDKNETQRNEWSWQNPSISSEIYSLPGRFVKSFFLVDVNCGYLLINPMIPLVLIVIYGFIKALRLRKTQSIGEFQYKKYMILIMFMSILNVIFNLSFFSNFKIGSVAFQLNRAYIFGTFVFLFFLYILIINFVVSDILKLKIVTYLALVSLVFGVLNFYPIRAKVQNASINASLQNSFVLKTQSALYNAFSGANFDLNEFRGKIAANKILTLKDYYHIGDQFSLQDYQRKLDNNKVLAIGINPMILAWHGWSTYNGYVFNYPLQHKKNFVSIVKTKIKSDAEYEKYIQNWGNKLILTLDPNDYSLFGVDLCEAKTFGVNYLASDKFVSDNENLRLYDHFGRILIYQILC